MTISRVIITLPEYVQDILFAAGELLTAVEDADDTLVTDSILAAAKQLREAITPQ